MHNGKAKLSMCWPTDWPKEKACDYIMQAWRYCAKANVQPKINDDECLEYVGRIVIPELKKPLKIKFIIDETAFVRIVFPFFEEL